MDKSVSKQLCIESDFAGRRLDFVLAALFPSTGLRFRRRLIETGFIFVNEKKVRPSYKVAFGDTITYKEVPPNFCDESLTILKEEYPFVFFHKPRFMHTAHIDGAITVSVERLLPQFFEQEKPLLLSRLDYATSGIIPAVFGEEEKNRVRNLEHQGNVKKLYFALLEGAMENSHCVSYALISKSRKKMRVDATKVASKIHRTLIEPLYSFRSDKIPSWLHIESVADTFDCTLALCTIYSGMRHQIRAHAAYIGYPLVGDALYGSKAQFVKNVDMCFYLHHAAFFLPTRNCIDFPMWLDPLEQFRTRLQQ